ncbi:MAG: restriction endonuclease subunit S [Donghicola eburneus]|nr:restriction endonuclease subunit S [Donghicola eburneus]MCI5041241.1 restriction endonuclease subunit S [Donghicola eburneus]
MVPEGWQEQSLDKVFKLASGSTKPSDVVAEHSDESPHPVYGGNGVLGYSAQSNHPGNVILIGRVGEYCGVTRRVEEPCWITDNALYAKDFFPENDIKFITYRLQHFDVSRLRSKGGQPLVSQKPIYLTKFSLPPLPEQRKIAEILSTWDRAIETAEALLATTRTQKRALMQTLLTGKRRFPEFEGQEWREVRFEEVFNRVRRKNTVGNENTLTISGQDGLVSQQAYFNKRVAAADLSGYTLLVGGDFAYNKSYSAGYPMGAIKMLPDGKTGVVSSLYLCFALGDPDAHCREFFRHFFEAGCFNHEIYKIAQEGARNHGLLNVSVTDFFRAKIKIPDLEEQRRIADAINLAEREEARDLAVLEKLRTEKKALMQQLLTGKRRVALE